MQGPLSRSLRWSPQKALYWSCSLLGRAIIHCRKLELIYLHKVCCRGIVNTDNDPSWTFARDRPVSGPCNSQLPTGRQMDGTGFPTALCRCPCNSQLPAGRQMDGTGLPTASVGAPVTHSCPPAGRWTGPGRRWFGAARCGSCCPACRTSSSSWP